MKKITDKKQIFYLTALCVAAYLVSYLTRKNFNAVLAEFTVAEGVEKSAASIITVALFIFYGAGQLLSGYLGDKFSPRKIMTAGLILTTAVNAIMPFLGTNVVVMAAFWAVNGVAQAFMWPPMVKIMASRFTVETYKDAVVKVSMGSAVGTMLIYAVAALFIKLFNDWKTVFYFASVCGLIMAVIWEIGVSKVEKYADTHGEEITSDTVKNEKPLQISEKNKKFNPLTMSPIIIMMIAIVLVALVSSAMHGVNLILIGMVPQKYEKYGNVSVIAGLINFCTYVGSAVFTYGIAKIAEVWDWKITIFSWFVIALAGTALCFVTIKSWKNFKER